MKFEVIEGAGEWIVRRNGVELARFGEQLAALTHVADRLRGAEGHQVSYSLAMRYLARA
jgi:hypothetical protein